MQSKNLFALKRAFTRSLIGALALSLISPLPAATAIANQTVSCSGGGTFRIESNIVTSSTGCIGAVNIPVGVVQIGTSAFNHAVGNGVSTGASVTSVVIPSTVTTIDRRAFYNATSITSITIPNSVTSVGDYAFFGMSSLRNVTIGSGLTEIASGVFSGASSLTVLSIPSNISIIGTGAFASSTSLTKVLISGNMFFIGDGAFAGATSLSSVYFLGAAPTFMGDNPVSFINTATGATAYVTASNRASFTLTAGKWKGLSVSLGDPVASDFSTETDSTSAAASAAAAAKAAIQAATAQREAEIQAARAKVVAAIKDSQELTVDSFTRAQIPGITASNIGDVKAELLALRAEVRSDINQVLKVARKYEVVGIIASDQVANVLPSAFVEIGLIPEASKNKVALTAAVKNLSPEARDSFSEIKSAIDIASAVIKKRADRLAKVLAKQAARSGR